MLLEATTVGIISLAAIIAVLKKDSETNKICDYSELKNLIGDGLILSQNVRLSW